MRARNKVASRARRKKLLKSARGYWGKRKNNIRRVKETRRRAMVYATRDRKAKKRTFRSLWITRINAAATEAGTSYRELINKLKIKNILFSRDILAKIAAEHPAVFSKIVESAKN